VKSKKWARRRKNCQKMNRLFNIKVGDIYEDCAFHPVLCTFVTSDGSVGGISLVDGSYPRCCSLFSCGVQKLTVAEAEKICKEGPSSDKKKHMEYCESQGWGPYKKWWVKNEVKV
jgi:hypothetical protein